MKMKIQVLILLFAGTLFSCTDKDDSLPVDTTGGPQLIVKFKFDPAQVRLDNFGQPSTVAAGNAAQTPVFNSISSHYLEFAPNANTALGSGTILYRG